MATPVIMPKFGMAQEEGTILRWHKAEGDHVHKGDVILEVMTDKVDMEVEALRDGILAGVRYGPDTTLPVTTVLAYLLEPGEALPAGADTPVADTVRTAAESVVSPAAKGDVKASPVAQRVAAAQAWTCARSRAAGRAAASSADVRRCWRPRPRRRRSRRGRCGRRQPRGAHAGKVWIWRR
ncbi:MAG: hypothetical protein H6644_03605 [Caldilineaceae bacterium]|nr:hypothetical protein [Caldilineaceae bacterium]